MINLRINLAAVLFAVGASIIPVSSDLAAQAHNSLQQFAVLSGTSITCSGLSAIVGTVGASLGNTVSGFPPCAVTRIVRTVGGPLTTQARSDLGIVYHALASAPCDSAHNLTGQDLGGKTLKPGVYCFAAPAHLTGTLILDGRGNIDPEFIFQINGPFMVAANSSVAMINGVQANGVFWQVDGAVTVGSHSAVSGNILAAAGITLQTGANVIGRTLALNGAVAMQASSVSVPPKPASVCAERVIGGGSIIGPTGTRASFGIGSGIKNGTFWGNLKYYDYGVDVRGMGGTVYVYLGPTTRRIEGIAAVNGHAGYTYQIDVDDNSETGRSDTFSIRLSNGYSASGTLVGGNILLDPICERNHINAQERSNIQEVDNRDY